MRIMKIWANNSKKNMRRTVTDRGKKEIKKKMLISQNRKEWSKGKEDEVNREIQQI